MKTVFCTFLDSRDKNGAITIKPLGLAKNKVHKPMLPGWKDVVTDQYDRVGNAKVPKWVSKLVF